MKIRTRGLFAGLMFAAVALAATATVDPNRYLNDIKFLASPELRGRGTGSPESSITFCFPNFPPTSLWANAS